VRQVGVEEPVSRTIKQEYQRLARISHKSVTKVSRMITKLEREREKKQKIAKLV